MARYTITHSCGHDADRHLDGPTKDRDRRARWWADQLCPACHVAERDAKRAAESREAAVATAAGGLPALTGSDAQVEWAERIRGPVARVLLAMDDGAAAGELLAPFLTDAAKAEVRDAIALITSEVLDQPTARWWIDNRETFGGSAWANEQSIAELDARRYLTKQLNSRMEELCPTAFDEVTAERARRRAQAEVDKARVSELAGTIRVDDSTVVTPRFSGPLTIRDGDVLVEIRGGYVTVTEGGRKLLHEGATSHRDGEVAWFTAQDRANKVIRDRDRRAAEAARDAVLASLAGVTVTAAARTNRRSEPNLDVTLSDGRSARGWLVKSEGRLDIVIVDGQAVPSDHPNVARLAAEAGKVAAPARKEAAHV